MKKILITAGSTVVPVDKVRVISNIFKGKTGTQIARHFSEKKNDVTLITSNTSLLSKEDRNKFRVVPFQTYEDLEKFMSRELLVNKYDVVIHSAAVSDYEVVGVFIKDEHGNLVNINKKKKVSSNHMSLFFKLSPTAKIIDKIRTDWKFRGKLVKFKLEVGISELELISISKKSMHKSKANMIVANCLEWAHQYAIILDENNNTLAVSRRRLAEELYVRLI